MKTKVFALLSLFFLMSVSFDAMSQRGRRASDVRPQQRITERPAERPERLQRGEAVYCMMIPDLTEEQEEQIKTLRLQQLERNTRYRNGMDELRARKRNLMIGNDQGDIDAVIDEMTALRNDQMKQNVAHHQAIRELLTEEQRIIYDNKTMRRSGGHAAYGRQAPARNCINMPRPGGRGRW
ncbi:MAG: hypothetical protein EA394_02995 [Bacteroidia bacterium]|nr:MAG: hypothetical protein EA394_02995 [Bacteroidia bacterium]